MPLFKKIILKKKAGGERGTESQDAVLEQAKNEWDRIQDQFKDKPAEEQELMIEHFNSATSNDGLGDALFGDDANYPDFEEAVKNLD